jgi:hypothetical protein
MIYFCLYNAYTMYKHENVTNNEVDERLKKIVQINLV